MLGRAVWGVDPQNLASGKLLGRLGSKPGGILRARSGVVGPAAARLAGLNRQRIHINRPTNDTLALGVLSGGM